MQRSLSHYDINPLCTFLSDTIGRSNAERLFKLYQVGTSKKWNGSAVFWQVDSNGQVHAGKIMGYDAKTGHRLKVPHRTCAGCIPSCVCPASTYASVSLANIFLSATPTRQFSSWKARRRHSSQPTSCRTACGWRLEERTAVSTKRPFVYWRIGMWY